MSKRRYHRRSKMKRRGVKNGSQHGSKMAPKWLPGGLWAALGPDPAARRSPEPSRRGSGTARGVPKIHLGGLGTPLERKVDRFRPPGGSPGGSRRGSGRSFGELFGGWAGGNEKKSRKVTKKSLFWELFLHAFSYRSRVCSVCLGARRRERTT